MTDKRVVLVTGVGGYWGARVAAQLLADHADQLHVIGLDITPPPDKIKGLDFIEADIRNPALIELLQAEAVDTVCHLAFIESARPSEATFDVNVMGTMKVLGACAESHIRKIVLMSSTLVYGAQPGNSLYLREDQPLNGAKDYDYIRSLMEIEAFINGYRRQRPEMVLTTLRFPHNPGLHRRRGGNVHLPRQVGLHGQAHGLPLLSHLADVAADGVVGVRAIADQVVH